MYGRADVEELLSRQAHGGGWGPLARAITRVENSAPWEVELPSPPEPVHVIGITGPPGAGKSTLTGCLIEEYANAGVRVAVLAIDPSSPISGGAVLGDRVRMETHLSGRRGVFVRSLASRGSHGAVAGATRNVARLLELSGSFDVILIETVGAGQTEIAVAELADTVVLVTVPGLGDAVQAIKAGVMEVADMVVVNMADRPGAPETVRDLRLALGRDVTVTTTIATEGTGVDALRRELDARWRALVEAGGPDALRARKRAREAQLVAEAQTRAHPGFAEELDAARVQRWRQERLAADDERVPPRREEFATLSGIPIEEVYTPLDVEHVDAARDIGLPGEYPYTRGPHASMYRNRPWTIRQVSGFGQAEDTNGRYKYLLAQGETGLSTDFDLPTLLGHDSDHEVYRREIGKIGVAVDTVVDVHALFDGIPLDEVSTSLTINAPAAVLLAMYRVVADERGIPGSRLTGTTQNDILKEYTAQNEFIFPPAPSTELVVDTMEYGAQVMPRFNPLNVCGYHIREAGATAVEEVGLTVSAALCYLERARERGIEPDLLAPRVSFFWDVHNDFLEEVAKLRAARRLWARATRERLGCRNPRSWLMRAHCQTAGVSLTAQQPLNNVARTAIQALAAVFGGTQSLHTNSLDEALAIPSEEAIKVAVRTQQIVLHETGAADVVDPLGGSYYIESLTSRIEEEAAALVERIDELGGMIAAVESGHANRVIADSAWEQQLAFERDERVTVGVNAFADDDRSTGGIELFRLDPGVGERQLKRLAAVRRAREERRVAAALRELEATAADLHRNRMPLIEEAVRARATVGEICDVLRSTWGEYRPSTVF